MYPYDPRKAAQLLAEAGYPNGFDAEELYCDDSYSGLAEAVANYLKAVGIRMRLRPLERVAFFSQLKERKLKHVIQIGSGAFGNAATRIDAFVAAGDIYTYGTYPDIEGLIQEQESGVGATRETVIHKIQQFMHDKVMYAPIWELAFLNGVGPRVAESGLGLIAGHAYSAPYEDLRLTAK